MKEKQYAICERCLAELCKDGLMLAAYYQSICEYVAALNRPYVSPQYMRPLSCSTMLQYLEKKGFVVTTEFVDTGIERQLALPARHDTEDGMTFCACRKNPGFLPG